MTDEGEWVEWEEPPITGLVLPGSVLESRRGRARKRPHKGQSPEPSSAPVAAPEDG